MSGFVSDARSYQTRGYEAGNYIGRDGTRRTGGIGCRYQTRGGIPRGRYQTRGGIRRAGEADRVQGRTWEPGEEDR